MGNKFFEVEMGSMNSIFISIDNIAFVQDTPDEVVIIFHKNLKGQVGQKPADTDTFKFTGEGAEKFRDWFEQHK